MNPKNSWKNINVKPYFTSSQTDWIKPNHVHVHVHVHVLWITNHSVELRIFDIKKYFGMKEGFIFKMIW